MSIQHSIGNINICKYDIIGQKCNYRFDPAHAQNCYHFAEYINNDIVSFTDGQTLCQYSLTNLENVCILKNDTYHNILFYHNHEPDTIVNYNLLEEEDNEYNYNNYEPDWFWNFKR